MNVPSTTAGATSSPTARALLHRRVSISSGTFSSSDFALDTMRTRTGLDRVALRDALAVLTEGSPEASSFGRDAFADGLVAIAKSALTTTPVREVVRIAHFLFDLFADGLLSVGLAEIASGLAALCTASPRMEKLRVAFELYDADDSNSISPDEMERYLTAVFRVAFATQPGVQESMGGISASALATLSVGDAFREADLNGSGELTWDEFSGWARKHAREEVVEEEVVEEVVVVPSAAHPVLHKAGHSVAKRGSVFHGVPLDLLTAHTGASGLTTVQPAYFKKLSTGLIARWQRRWFWLSNNYLLYAAGEEGGEMNAGGATSIDLRRVESITDASKGSAFEFNIIGEGLGGASAENGEATGIFRVRVKSKVELELWVNAMRQRQGYVFNVRRPHDAAFAAEAAALAAREFADCRGAARVAELLAQVAQLETRLEEGIDSAREAELLAESESARVLAHELETQVAELLDAAKKHRFDSTAQDKARREHATLLRKMSALSSAHIKMEQRHANAQAEHGEVMRIANALHSRLEAERTAELRSAEERLVLVQANHAEVHALNAEAQLEHAMLQVELASHAASVLDRETEHSALEVACAELRKERAELEAAVAALRQQRDEERARAASPGCVEEFDSAVDHVAAALATKFERQAAAAAAAKAAAEAEAEAKLTADANADYAGANASGRYGQWLGDRASDYAGFRMRTLASTTRTTAVHSFALARAEQMAHRSAAMQQRLQQRAGSQGIDRSADGRASLLLPWAVERLDKTYSAIGHFTAISTGDMRRSRGEGRASPEAWRRGYRGETFADLGN
jgi:Ca2+-binding EF-hand superfamily protein